MKWFGLRWKLHFVCFWNNKRMASIRHPPLSFAIFHFFPFVQQSSFHLLYIKKKAFFSFLLWHFFHFPSLLSYLLLIFLIFSFFIFFFFFFINSSSHPNLSIPPPPYFYQFLLLLIFINSSFSSLFFSIPFLVQIHFSFPDSNRYCNLKWNKLS